ncbi:uncharacterized protein METZ01_LOCUS465996 [marine metagenome]|uniref:Uncharacterized protein n=1 Tax=marine metagenome TaxID=408172 RepID=A0A383AZL5_9ZZZZ
MATALLLVRRSIGWRWGWLLPVPDGVVFDVEITGLHHRNPLRRRGAGNGGE